jgi:hypothetical protein
MQQPNYTKICGITGIILGEAYMLYTVLAPRGAAAVPIDYTLKTIVVLFIFFGAFGGLVGTGIGLVLAGLLGKKPAKPPAAGNDDPASK